MNEQPHHNRLTRSRSDRYVGGVAAGIARHVNVDPVFIRVAFVAGLLFGGVGLVVYAVLLALVPVEGDPAEPLLPIEPKRRNLMISLAVVVGVIAIIAAGSGDFAGWAFGFWPGTLFGILLWVAAGTVLAWLLAATDLRRSGGRTTPVSTPTADDKPRSAPTEVGIEAATEVATYAESPTQLSTELMKTRVMADDPHSGRSDDEEAGPDDGPHKPGNSSASATVGRIMFWFAIGFAVLFLFCTLFVVSAGTTAIFGGIPMAVLAIVLGTGMVFAGLRGQRPLSLWLLTAAIAVTLPMAVVSLADLRIKGSYGDIPEAPLTTADIPADGYRMAAGNMSIDLRKFDFERHRSLGLPVSGGIGLTSVIVPDRVCVASRITGSAGLIDVRGRQISGIDISRELSPPQGPAPRLKLNGRFKLGVFEVVDATTWRNRDSFESRQGRNAGPSGWDSADRSAARNRADAACRPGIRPGRPGHRQGSRS